MAAADLSSSPSWGKLRGDLRLLRRHGATRGELLRIDHGEPGRPPKSTTAADPDGAGAQQAIKRWFVYDLAGRTAGLLTTTADVAESSLGTQPWVCTSFDSRGRPTSTSYPAFGGAAARTVTSDYSNPLEVKVTDPVGAITTTVDLLGRTTKYRDALGNETTSSYDVADRPVSSTLLGQTTTNSYLPDGLLDTVSVNGKVLSDNSYAADGRLTGVAYPSGASGSAMEPRANSATTRSCGHRVSHGRTPPVRSSRRRTSRV